jgi:hypothetical protein
MKTEIEKLILQELETELGFKPDEEAAKECVEYYALLLLLSGVGEVAGEH